MFHCLVIKVFSFCLSDSSFILSHLFLFVKYFFQVFSNIFELRFCCRFVDDLDTLSYLLSFVNYFFIFSETLKMSTLNSTFFHIFIVLPFCTIRSLFYCIFSLLDNAIARLPLLPASHAPLFPFLCKLLYLFLE